MALTKAQCVSLTSGVNSLLTIRRSLALRTITRAEGLERAMDQMVRTFTNLGPDAREMVLLAQEIVTATSFVPPA